MARLALAALLSLILAVGCNAFAPVASRLASRVPALRMSGKINESIQKDSPKVVTNVRAPVLLTYFA